MSKRDTAMDYGRRHRLNVLGTSPIKILAMAMVITAFAGCAGYAPGRQSYWDEKVKEMCEKDGGTRIFEVVDLPKQQYDVLRDKFGELNIPPDGPNTREAPYYRKDEFIYFRDGNPSVWRYELVVIRRSDQKILGRRVVYSRVGGDFPGPAHTSSFSCPEGQVNLFTAVIKQSREEK